jgi:hypothetical protein
MSGVSSPLRRNPEDTPAEHLGGLRLRHPVDPHQVEDVPLVLRQLADRLEYAVAVRAEPGAAAGRRGHEALAQFHSGRLTI